MNFKQTLSIIVICIISILIVSLVNADSSITKNEILTWKITGQELIDVEDITYIQINDDFEVDIKYKDHVDKSKKVKHYTDMYANVKTDKDIDSNGKLKITIPKKDVKKHKVGDSSIIFEVQNESTIVFDFTDEGLGTQNITIRRNSSTGFDLIIDEINVSVNQENYKFSATDSTGKDINLYQYHLSSTKKIKRLTDFTWFIEGESISRQYDFNDVCSRMLIDNLTPHCQFNNPNPYNIYIQFLSNSTIDPTVTITNISSINSIKNNVTIEELPFSHLSLSNLSIMGYYTFDHDGSVLYDLSDYNKNGNLNGNVPFRSNGYIGGSRYFRGVASTDYINLGNNLRANRMSASIWVKSNQTQSNGFGVFFGKWDGDFSYHWSIDDNVGGNGLVPKLFLRIGAVNLAVSHTSKINYNQWVNLGFTWDGTTVKTFYNGVLNSTNIGNGNISTSTASASIGGKTSGALAYTGFLDELIVFNGTVSNSNMNKIYQNTYKKFYNKGFQKFNRAISQNGTINTINITSNSLILNGSSINLRLEQFDISGVSLGFTSYQNLQNGNNNIKYNISTSTYNITLDYNFLSNPNGLTTPYLENTITINSYQSGDVTPPAPDDFPNITQISPSNNTKTSNTAVSFFCDADDDKLIDFMTLYTNESGSLIANGTIDFNSDDVSAEFQRTYTPNITIQWRCSATDNISQETQSELFNLEINQTFQAPPVPPPQESYSLSTCPLQDIPTMLLFAFFIIIAFVVIIIGFIFKNGLVGALGSLLLLVLSAYIYICIFVMGFMLTGISLMLCSFFLVRGSQGKL